VGSQADMYESFVLEVAHMPMNTHMFDLYSHEIAVLKVVQNPRKTHM